MLKNYFLVAFRNFWHNKVFSLINILGLSIGISAILVISLIVSYEFGFDRFEDHRDRIFRIVTDYSMSGEPGHNGGVCYAMGPAVRKELTGIDLVAAFSTAGYELGKVTVPDSKAKDPTVFKKQTAVAFADPSYCSLLGYTWLAGSEATALSRPYQTVLTETNAHLYFPNLAYREIIGRQLIFADTILTTVTGILKDLPQPTDFYCKTLISWTTLERYPGLQSGGLDNWGSTTGASQLFIKAAPGASAAILKTQMQTLYRSHRRSEPGNDQTVNLQPLSDLHFNSDYGNFDEGRLAHKPTLYGLLAVGAFLLLLACINFINLTTAQSSQRAREIGIRKTMGGSRLQLGFQFLNETFLLTLMATLLSSLMTPLLLKIFADFIPAGLHFDLSHQPVIIGWLLLLIVAVSLFSGAYPAFVLSAFNPIPVLKNQIYAGTSQTRSAWFRRALTISQFVIAQVFIIATILVGRQINYALNKDLGFTKEAIITFYTPWNQSPTKRNVLLQQLKTFPGITNVSLSNNPPSSESTWSSNILYKGGKNEIKTQLQFKYADTSYLKLYHLRLIAGSNITQCDTSNAIIINATYAHLLGFRDAGQAVGARLEWNGHPVPVVGVIADFYQSSLHTPIKPLAITNGTRRALMMNIALRPQSQSGDWQSALTQIGTAYHALYPDEEFAYTFLDDSIAKYYKSEQDISRLLAWATGLAIIISCLGLLGLVIYITNQRTKEIGIRKVIGASVTEIILLLSRDFMSLVVLAILIAMPIAWWGSHKWIENFAYHADLSWWIFAAGGLTLLAIALITLCLRTFRAATANPVKSLRSE